MNVGPKPLNCIRYGVFVESGSYEAGLSIRRFNADHSGVRSGEHE